MAYLVFQVRYSSLAVRMKELALRTLGGPRRRGRVRLIPTRNHRRRQRSVVNRSEAESSESESVEEEPESEPAEEEPVVECTAELASILLPSFPVLEQPQLPEALRSAALLAILETTLRSAGDELKLELGGDVDVPIVPGIGVGGEVALSLSLSRDGHDSPFVLEGGAEAAGAANFSAGVLGAALGEGAALPLWLFPDASVWDSSIK